MSAESRIRTETYRVYTLDTVGEPKMKRGLVVSSFWDYGGPVRFLDCLMDPDGRYRASTPIEKLAFRLDEIDPPEEDGGAVLEAGLDGDMFFGKESLGVQRVVLNPNYPVYSAKAYQLGRYAIVCFIDNLPESVRQQKAANILDRGDATIAQSLGTSIIGASVLLMPPARPVEITNSGGSPLEPNDCYRVTYRPDDSQGLVVERKVEGRGSSDESEDQGGGSDRKPLQPIRPELSGAIELEKPRDSELETLPVIEIE